MRAAWWHQLPNDDRTDVPVTKPSGVGQATARSLTQDDVDEIAEREKRRVPLGFAPPDKRRRKPKP